MCQVSCSMSGILGVDQPFKKEKKTTADLARRGSVSTGVMRGSCRSFEKKTTKAESVRYRYYPKNPK